jgi:hypothetical protein
MEPIKIELGKYRGSSSFSFVGRPEGRDARRDLKLSIKDKDSNDYIFIIPENTTNFSSSFYLGLLYESFHDIGFKKALQKYRFLLPQDPVWREILENNISEAKRHAQNQLVTDGGGLKKFI